MQEIQWSSRLVQQTPADNLQIRKTKFIYLRNLPVMRAITSQMTGCYIICVPLFMFVLCIYICVIYVYVYVNTI